MSARYQIVPFVTSKLSDHTQNGSYIPQEQQFFK